MITRAPGRRGRGASRGTPAGVVEGDWSEHVTEVVCRIGERYPKGRLVIAITEAPGGAP